MNITWFDYKYLLFTSSFLLSQLARYDFFTDVVFMINCFKNPESETLGYLAMAVLITISFFQIKEYIKSLTEKENPWPLPTEELSRYYKASELLEMHALSDVLDVISCYNVVELP